VSDSSACNVERNEEDNPTFITYCPEGDSKRIDYKEGIFVGYRGYEKNKVKRITRRWRDPSMSLRALSGWNWRLGRRDM
jgi:hypothetical protein